MGKRIFAIGQDNQITAMQETLYETEDLFQSLIEKCPDLLAGDQINEDTPRKWLFVCREASIPDEEGGSGRWFLDHLFIDQDAVPTFVEVKRSTDTRIRREVVAQMLDYAANATSYWPVGLLREWYEKSEKDIFSEWNYTDDQIEIYWQNVSTNLKAGKLRLLFVADEIPLSLQRIIEFLNDQMTATEVLGLEIKQYLAQDGINRTLVPHLVGKTAVSTQTKNQQNREWDETSFLEDVRRSSGDEAVVVCQKLLYAFINLGCRIWWGHGKTHGSFVPVYEGKQSHPLCSVYPWTNKTQIELYFQYYQNKEPFSSLEKRQALRDHFQDATGILIPDNRLDKRPSFDWSILKSEKTFQHVMSVFEEYINIVKTTEASQ